MGLPGLSARRRRQPRRGGDHTTRGPAVPVSGSGAEGRGDLIDRGLIPDPHDPVYAAAKTGVTALVRSIAPTPAAKGVVITAICPGGTLTGMMHESFVERGADGSLA